MERNKRKCTLVYRQHKALSRLPREHLQMVVVATLALVAETKKGFLLTRFAFDWMKDTLDLHIIEIKLVN